MAEREQLNILRQGVDAWNKWREANPETKIDLSSADLRGADLRQFDLQEADLSEADLWETDLWDANLQAADLRKAGLQRADLNVANLRKANLQRADLSGAVLWEADLWSANLQEATLHEVDLRDVNLRKADLRKADFLRVDLLGADLREADLGDAHFLFTYFNQTQLTGSIFTRATIAETTFVALDISGVIGLDTVHYNAPSTLGTDTIRLSKGKIPEAFMRGCGLSDWEIESAKLYAPDLRNAEINDINIEVFRLRGQQALQISSLFISYSHSDGSFVDKIEQHLNAKGIRFWRDVHDATAGRLEKVIDRAIRINETVLLVLSNDSVQSDWVEYEINHAHKLGKESGRDVLCPVSLDDAWKKPNPWSQVLMDQVKKFNILDFSKWEEDNEFDKKFGLLLEGLELFYKKKKGGI